MNPPNVEPSEMTRATVIDREIHALLEGRPPVLDSALAAELASLRDHLIGSFPLPEIPKQTQDAHMVRMMQSCVPPTTTVEMSPLPFPQRAKAALSRRVAAATLAFTAAFGGAAYAGVLPAPIQDAVASAAALVGIDLPTSDRDVSPDNVPNGRLDGRAGVPNEFDAEEDASDAPDDSHEVKSDVVEGSEGENPKVESPEKKASDNGERDEKSDRHEEREDVEDEADDPEERSDEAEDRADDRREAEDVSEEDGDDAGDSDEAEDPAEDATDDESDDVEDDGDSGQEDSGQGSDLEDDEDADPSDDEVDQVED